MRGELADVLLSQQKYEEAETALLSCLLLLKEVNGVNHETTLWTMNKLCDVFWHRYQYVPLKLPQKG